MLWIKSHPVYAVPDIASTLFHTSDINNLLIGTKMDYKGQPAGNPPPPPPPGYSQPPPQYGKYYIHFFVHFVEFYLELKSVLKSYA